MENCTYGIKYKIEVGEFSHEHLEEEDFGGCDALLLVSIMREGRHAHDGPLSVKYFSDDIPGWMRDIARKTFEEAQLACLTKKLEVVKE